MSKRCDLPERLEHALGLLPAWACSGILSTTA
jgi:hypothetical protein